MILSLGLYFVYLLLLLFFIFVLLSVCSLLKNQNVNVSDLRTLDLEQELSSLVLQKEEHLIKIGELQDQLSTILITTQKKFVLDSILEFFYNNSDFFVGISIFLIALVISNMFAKADLDVFTSEIITNQDLRLIVYNSVTKQALMKTGNRFFYTLNEIDKKNVEVILQQIQELVLKTQTIDTQILQILDLLSK